MLMQQPGSLARRMPLRSRCVLVLPPSNRLGADLGLGQEAQEGRSLRKLVQHGWLAQAVMAPTGAWVASVRLPAAWQA